MIKFRFDRFEKIVLTMVAIVVILIVGISIATAGQSDLQLRMDRTVVLVVAPISPDDQRVSGTGFVLDSSKMLTAAHLFGLGTSGFAASPAIVFNFERIPKKLHAEGEVDATLTTGKKPHGHVPVRCTPPRLGERITTMGYPAGLGPIFMRGMVASAEPIEPGSKYIVVGLELEAGISGAPMFDTEGRLMGVLVSSLRFQVGGLGAFVSTVDIVGLCYDRA